MSEGRFAGQKHLSTSDGGEAKDQGAAGGDGYPPPQAKLSADALLQLLELAAGQALERVDPQASSGRDVTMRQAPGEGGRCVPSQQLPPEGEPAVGEALAQGADDTSHAAEEPQAQARSLHPLLERLLSTMQPSPPAVGGQLGQPAYPAPPTIAPQATPFAAATQTMPFFTPLPAPHAHEDLAPQALSIFFTAPRRQGSSGGLLATHGSAPPFARGWSHAAPAPSPISPLEMALAARQVTTGIPPGQRGDPTHRGLVSYGSAPPQHLSAFRPYLGQGTASLRPQAILLAHSASTLPTLAPSAPGSAAGPALEHAPSAPTAPADGVTHLQQPSSPSTADTPPPAAGEVGSPGGSLAASPTADAAGSGLRKRRQDLLVLATLIEEQRHWTRMQRLKSMLEAADKAATW